MTTRTMEAMRRMEHIHILFWTMPGAHGIVTFTVDGVHPHDISEIPRLRWRGHPRGHHHAQPLLKHLGFSSTARASFAFTTPRRRPTASSTA